MGSTESRQSFYIGIKGIIQSPDGVVILEDAERGKWELPGGRVDQGQDLAEAFRREVSEEITGASFETFGPTVHADVGDFIVENDHRLLLVFRVAEVALPEVIQISHEHRAHAMVQPTTLGNFELYDSDRTALEIYFSS